MKKNIKEVAIAVCICVVITLLVAGTNTITAPLIAQNQNAAANAALLEVMSEGKGFEPVDISTYELPATVTEVYKESSGLGYVVKMVTAGYGSDMVIMCGVKNEGIVTGAVCISSNETLGKEKTYGENFTDKNAEGVEAVEIIAGATKTTEAYKNAVKDALNTVIILGGGEVDIRTEEEILADNLKTALPEGDTFVKLFLVEAVEGVNAIYKAENGAGYVCVVGEEFIGVGANGTDNAQVAAAVEAVKNSKVTDIDVSAYPDLTYLVSAQKTASGNYIVETKGAGYGINGGNEYHPASGEHIVVKVSISADGSIIDCMTVSQAETQGLGDACAKETFYGQFNGKTKDNYTEIDGISGATLTTDGYKQAILRAFEAVNVLKGGK